MVVAGTKSATGSVCNAAAAAVLGRVGL